MRIKKFIQDLFGITQLIEEKRKQTELLEKIADHCRQTGANVTAIILCVTNL